MRTMTALRQFGPVRLLHEAHVEHLPQADDEERAASLGLILGADTKLLMELDPLCRAVLVTQSCNPIVD